MSPRNPYDFVPLEDSPQRDGQHLSQHSIVACLTGEIKCVLTVLTPLFIGSGKSQEQGKRSVFFPYKSAGQVIIPASSLKGMVRSVVEVASNSCMSALSEAHGGMRIRVPQGYTSCTNLEQLCPACALFGMSEGKDNETGDEEANREKRSLAGRVSFSDATSVKQRSPTLLKVSLPARLDTNGKIVPIGNPKPKHEAFYFENGVCLGRKFYYRTRRWDTVLETYRNRCSKGFGVYYRTIVVEAIPGTSQFEFVLHFNNLAQHELDLLLYGLQLEPGLCHALGYGKPFGLGSVKIHLDYARTLRFNVERSQPNLYLQYDLTGKDTQIWEQFIPDVNINSIWERGTKAQVAHARFKEIFHEQRDEEFYYPERKWFRDNPTKTLAEYQGRAPTRSTAISSNVSQSHQRGEVKWVHPDRKYGFIQIEGSNRELFVHINNVQGRRELHPGQQVEFEEGPGREPGKTEAKNVKPL